MDGSWPMTGVLKGKGYKKGENSRFGYIGVEAEKRQPVFKAGRTDQGHEFHYWIARFWKKNGQ